MKSDESSPSGNPQTYQRSGTCYNLPWSAIILVGLTVGFHGAVLWGNLQTAEMFDVIGKSTHGWSEVGLSVSHSMIYEIEHYMTKTTVGLTKTLGAIVTIQEDIYMLFGHAGNTTKKAISHFQESQRVLKANKSAGNELLANPKQMPGTEILASGDVQQTHALGEALLEQDDISAVEVKRRMQDNETNEQPPPGFESRFHQYIHNVPELKEKIHHEVEMRLKQVHKYVQEFWNFIHPALVQIGKFLVQMGSKMQGFIEQFSVIIDRVQKIMDQIMSKISGPDNVKQHMVYNTFNIFDVHHEGYITVQDMHEVANLYGVTALAGTKGREIHHKYDYNHDGKLTMAEYSKMVMDPSVPGIMSNVLRCFSKRLAQIAGTMKGAKLRDQVGLAVTDYLQLMVAKNLTKCHWVSQALVNGSLPIQFSADVMKNLVLAQQAPDKLTTINVGQKIMDIMVSLNETAVDLIFDEVANHKFWVHQGFSPASQPKIIHTIKKWVIHAKKKEGTATNSLLQEEAELSEEAITKHYEKLHQEYANELKQERAEHGKRIFHSEATHHIAKSLLGTYSTTGPKPDADVTRVLSGGRMALPATVKWKTWLVDNATDTAQRFQNYSFDYTKTSSNPIDSFATQIQAMVKKIQSFLHLMMKYSTKRGIHEIGEKVSDFTEKSAHDINKITDNIVDEMLHPNGTSKGVSLSQISMKAPGKIELHGVWKEIDDMLGEMKGVFPPVIGDVKFAHKEIGMVANTLKSIFSIFKVKGNPIFSGVATIYRVVWYAYFGLFGGLTGVILFYAFWAYGFFGGPDTTEEDEEGAAPKEYSCKDRCCQCWNACLHCLRSTQDSHCCFWSCILMCEVVILLLFIVSIVLAILSGIKAFINVGCMQIYLLGDNTVCTSILKGITNWMDTFWETENDSLSVACSQKELTTCKTITQDMMLSVIMTAGGSVAAAIFSFQMLFMSAQLHERAVWTNKLKGLKSVTS